MLILLKSTAKKRLKQFIPKDLMTLKKLQITTALNCRKNAW